MTKTVILYSDRRRREPFTRWLLAVRDTTARYRIQARIRRIESGNYGDHRRFGGIIEFRLDFGPGHRIYAAEDGNTVVILLTGGDKSTQKKDIQKALEYLEDYHEQKKTQNI